MSLERTAGATPRRASLNAVAIIVILAAGCASPSAVKRFASASTAAGKSFPAIADELPASCVRRERYHFLGSWQSDIDSLDALTRKTCSQYTRAAPRLAAAQRALAGYLDALGRLASGDVVDYDRSAAALGDALADVDPTDEPAIDAVRSLSATVIEAATYKWRRKELSGMIAKCNADVQTLASALRGVIEKDYAQLLDGEWEAARKFYLGMLSEHRDREPLTAVLVYEKWRGEEEAINERRKTARSYVKLLERIAAGHQDLYDHRDELSSKEVKSLVLKHAEAIEDFTAGVRRVF